MDLILVDTGYWLALELARDQNHTTALAHWRSLTGNLPRLVTTSYIFDEVVTFFNNRGYHDKAVQVGNWLLHSPSSTWFMSMRLCFLPAGLIFKSAQTRAIL